MSLIKVKSPATTANLGPGLDCLGMAVDIWNFLEVEWWTNNKLQESSIEVHGEGTDELATDTSNLVYQAIKFLFVEAGHQLPEVRLRCENYIPLSRGLGSSAAAISSGLVAANFMHLNNEKSLIYIILSMTVVFFIVLLALLHMLI